MEILLNKFHKPLKMKKTISILLILFTIIYSCEENTVKHTSDYWIQHKNTTDSILQRYGAVAFTLAKSAYIGMGYNNDYLDDFWRFDTISNDWTEVAAFGGNRRIYPVAFTIDNNAYAGLGYSYRFIEIDTNVFVTDTIFYRDFWRYSAKTNNWEQIASFPGIPRGQAVAFSINNAGYVGTGVDTTGNPLKDFWKYEPENDKWIQVSDFGGNARFDAVAFTFDEKGYVAAGGASETTLYNDVWQYIPGSNQWIQKASMPLQGRLGAVAFATDTLAYICTGWQKGNLLKDVWEYAPELNKWTRKNNFAGEGRMHAVTLTIDNKAFIAGGFNSGDLWRYVIK